MTDAETAAHLRNWVRKGGDGHPLFGWPTAACGYEQHMRFVAHHYRNWYGGDWDAFLLAYANQLEATGR